MAVVVYNFVPLGCAGNLEACDAAARAISGAVYALQGEARCIGCTIDLIPDAAAAEDQVIQAERFQRAMGEAFAFPYLWVQVRYDPAVRSDADLGPIIERFRLATVGRFESRDPFFR
jgi:hypothetical protein